LFYDNWIPSQFRIKAIPNNTEALSEATVSSMIDLESKEWNIEKFQNGVAPFFIHKIMSIPIWKTVQDDVIIWPRSKDGSYTVRIGYQLLYEFENFDEATSSNPASSKAFWNRIWKLNIPNKMRFFC